MLYSWSKQHRAKLGNRGLIAITLLGLVIAQRCVRRNANVRSAHANVCLSAELFGNALLGARLSRAAFSFSLPHPMSGSGEPRSRPLDTSKISRALRVRWSGEGGYRSASASLAPSATKAAAKVRRIQASTFGREMTWARIEAANRP